MKTLAIILVLISNISFGQDLKLFFPEMDATLINLWQGNPNGINIDKQVTFLNTEWVIASEVICQSLDSHLDENHLNIKEQLTLLTAEADRKRINQVQRIALDILKEFRTLREKQVSFIYPLDYLLSTYDAVLEIDYTVHDLMFGLRYWFEFQDLLNDLECKWNSYRSISSIELLFYNQTLNLEQHEENCTKFENCMEDFLASLDSGYQPDFKAPCSDMKEALIDLIANYSRYEVYKDNSELLKQ